MCFICTEISCIQQGHGLKNPIRINKPSRIFFIPVRRSFIYLSETAWNALGKSIYFTFRDELTCDVLKCSLDDFPIEWYVQSKFITGRHAVILNRFCQINKLRMFDELNVIIKFAFRITEIEVFVLYDFYNFICLRSSKKSWCYSHIYRYIWVRTEKLRVGHRTFQLRSIPTTCLGFNVESKSSYLFIHRLNFLSFVYWKACIT